ncbi:MAG: hypothetical protein EXS36_13295 [Pedosphaera sp.]|nr:hypothetical protein [Pedosphaera sp.]
MNRNPLTLLLATTASLLAVATVWRAVGPKLPDTHAVSATDRPVGTAPPADLAESAQPTASGGAVNPFSARIHFDWSLVETNDFKRYILNLRRIQCPEPTIRDIVTADINKLFAPREEPLKQSLLPVGKGVGQQVLTALQRQDYERRKRLREVEREKAALVKELLGIELPLPALKTWHSRSYERYEAALDSLPPAKREQVREIQEGYWLASDELRDRHNSVRTPEYVEDYKKLNQQRQEMTGRVLEGRELEDYEIRRSTVAARLGKELAGFQPTEEEFRSLYKMHREVEESYGGTLLANQVEKFDAASNTEKEKELQESVRQELGPERYAAYQKFRDPKWQLVEKIDQRFQLGPEKMEETYEITREAVEFIERAKSGLLVEETAKQGDLLEQKLRTLLGDKAFAVYQARAEQVFARQIQTPAPKKNP